LSHRWNWISAVLLLSLAVVPLASSDRRTASLAANTLWLSAEVVALSLPVGCFLAFLLTRTDLPCRRPVTWLLAGFLFLPLYVQAGAWKAAFDLEGWLTAMRGGPPLLSGWRGAIWVHTVAAVPWVVLIVGAGLRLVERELEEQALLDGGPVWIAWNVTLRLAGGAVGIAALWTALITAGEMSVTDFFQVRTFAEELYTANALGDIQPLAGSDAEERLSGMSVYGGVFVGSALVAALLLMVAHRLPATRRGSARNALVFELGRWRWPVAAGMLLAIAILVVLPLASLAWKAGVEVVDSSPGRIRTWSAGKCLDMVALNPRIERGQLTLRHQNEIVYSLAVDSASATVSVILALCIGWFARRGTWRAWAGLASVGWLLAIPGPLIGLAIIALLNRPEIPGFVYLYDRTITAPMLACVARSLPLATLVVWAALRLLPSELLEAAELDGAILPQIWLYIVLPLRWPAIVLAWLVAFVMSLGELDASVLVAPPGPQPLSVHIFGLLHWGAEDQVAGICLAAYLAVQLAALAGWWMARKTFAANVGS
jgi:iron(III) transport system permease protein